uniref:Uncharacterized protein n=1 Tax=Clastoptera arizonana TaxID=38151 RepID=A0A1B6DFT7_9HEMI
MCLNPKSIGNYQTLSTEHIPAWNTNFVGALNVPWSSPPSRTRVGGCLSHQQGSLRAGQSDNNSLTSISKLQHTPIFLQNIQFTTISQPLVREHKCRTFTHYNS